MLRAADAVSKHGVGQDEHSLVSREALFASLFLVAMLNSVALRAVSGVDQQGWVTAAFQLFGVSAVLWAALGAGVHILASSAERNRPSRRDWWLAALVVALVLVPTAPASMAALTLLSVWAIYSAPKGSPLRRAGVIFLALAGALVWGRVLLELFSRPLLDLDAIFVATLLGSEHEGNMLWFAGEPTRLVVGPGCSSMQGISISLLLWVTVSQLFEVRFGWKQALWCLAAVAATVAINVFRIAALLSVPEHFQALHEGWGYQLSMWLTLLVVAAISVWGARGEIFNPV